MLRNHLASVHWELQEQGWIVLALQNVGQRPHSSLSCAPWVDSMWVLGHERVRREAPQENPE